MYWLIMVAGLAVVGVPWAQSIESDPLWELEPDYRKGYERPYPDGSDWRLAPTPGSTPSTAQEPWQADRLGPEQAPTYRFRGDPPPSSGPNPSAGEFRFRPLSPRERERMGSGPGLRWRPTETERSRTDGPGEPADLFDALVPGGPGPPPWAR